ncbi:hypothetical protein BLNAU_24896 [Blattamonas nauphoetae]|uniref:Secreted protein n=1 Tax=Blattamonas nauphoetae TaxID=2049346 RepID=A0ABQ9WLZ5_9EUKA|nr:hypothetical protein BLNAU_24896 [Blattamonas nauphoetae]
MNRHTPPSLGVFLRLNVVIFGIASSLRFTQSEASMRTRPSFACLFLVLDISVIVPRARQPSTKVHSAVTTKLLPVNSDVVRRRHKSLNETPLASNIAEEHKKMGDGNRVDDFNRKVSIRQYNKLVNNRTQEEHHVLHITTPTIDMFRVLVRMACFRSGKSAPSTSIIQRISCT